MAKLLPAVLTCALLALPLTGCDRDGGHPPPNEKPPSALTTKSQAASTAHYTMQDDHQTMILDGAGNVLYRTPHHALIFSDTLTEEDAYILEEIYHKIGEDAYGWPLTTTTARLLNFAGEEVYAAKDSYIMGLYGNYALLYLDRQEAGRNQFIDLRSGRLAVDHLRLVEAIGEDSLLLTYEDGRPPELVSHTLKVRTTLPGQYAFALYDQPDYLVIFADKDDPDSIFIANTLGEVVFPYNVESLSPGYVGRAFSDHYLVFDIATRQPIYQSSLPLQYYDGTLAIRILEDYSTELFRIKDEQVLAHTQFVNFEDQYIFCHLATTNPEAQGKDVLIFDRTGNILWQSDGEDYAYFYPLGNDRFLGYALDESNEISTVTIFTETGSPLSLPPRDYTYIYRATDEQDSYESRSPYLCAIYITPQGHQLMDILDNDGQLLVPALKYAYSFGSQGFVAEQGFQRGIMDYKGNWIKSYSIFAAPTTD